MFIDPWTSLFLWMKKHIWNMLKINYQEEWKVAFITTGYLFLELIAKEIVIAGN